MMKRTYRIRSFDPGFGYKKPGAAASKSRRPFLGNENFFCGGGRVANANRECDWGQLKIAHSK